MHKPFTQTIVFFYFLLFIYFLNQLQQLAMCPTYGWSGQINPASDPTWCSYVWANPDGSGGVRATNVSTKSFRY